MIRIITFLSTFLVFAFGSAYADPKKVDKNVIILTILTSPAKYNDYSTTFLDTDQRFYKG